MASDSSRIEVTRHRARRLGGLALASLTIVTAASLTPSAAVIQQQDQELYVELRARAARAITIAVPAMSVVSGAEEEATILRDILWNDLHNSMVFELVDPEFYPSIGGGDRTPDWPTWRQTGAEALIRGFVRRSGDGVVAEFRLFDVQSGQQVTGKSYPSDVPRTGALRANPNLRNIAHAFADEAVLYYTGIPGVAVHKHRLRIRPARPQGNLRRRLRRFRIAAHHQRRRPVALPGILAEGNQIAYVSYRLHDGIPNVDIAMLNQRGGVPPVIMRSKGLDGARRGPPTRSASRFLGHGRHSARQHRDLHHATDGSDLQRISSNSAIDTSPTFSPNGREIAFISARAGGQHLYKMSVDGTNLQRLRVEGSQIDSPAWNPNPQISDLIAYTASTGGNNFQIFVYSLTTRRSVVVTRGYGRTDSPSWSPDGRQIVFEATQGDETHIFAIGLDGSRLRQLTRESNNQSPSWGGR